MYAFLAITLVNWLGGGWTSASRTDTVLASYNLKSFSYKLLPQELLQNTFQTGENLWSRHFTYSNNNYHGNMNICLERKPTFIFNMHVKSWKALFHDAWWGWHHITCLRNECQVWSYIVLNGDNVVYQGTADDCHQPESKYWIARKQFVEEHWFSTEAQMLLVMEPNEYS